MLFRKSVAKHQNPFLAALSDPVDPSEVVLDLGVDTRVVGVSAADAPRHDALKFTIADQRSSRVALVSSKLTKSA